MILLICAILKYSATCFPEILDPLPLCVCPCAITTDVCEYEEGKQYFPINFVWQETQCNTSTLGQLLKQGELVITQSPTPSHASFI